MNKLNELIEKLCPNGVVYETLDKVCSVMTGNQLNKDKLLEKAEYPVINGGINPSGYWHEYNTERDTITISQGGASAGYVNYMETPFWAGAHCYVVKLEDDKVHYKYLYHYIKSIEKKLQQCQQGAGIPSVSRKSIYENCIPVPPLEVQCEIVHILDDFTLLSAELSAELSARKKQFNYYKNLLLENSTADKVKLGDCLLKVENIKWKQTAESHKYIDLSSVDRDNHTIVETKEIDKTNAPSRAQQIVKTDDVLFGGTRPMLKRSCLVDEIYNNEICSTGFCVLRADTTKILPKWIYFMISTNNFYNYVEQNQKGASYPAISDSDVKNYIISLPPINEQEKLVKLLDKFEKICNDISNGLPAEIEARQKQYEYYRDKLLTFKELKVNE